MAPATQSVEVVTHLQKATVRDHWKARNAEDGTLQLLRTGIWTLLVGVLSAVLSATVFGGISRHGPHSNPGWLSLMVAMMCLPFGLMVFALGVAKSLRNRRLAQMGTPVPGSPQ